MRAHDLPCDLLPSLLTWGTWGSCPPLPWVVATIRGRVAMGRGLDRDVSRPPKPYSSWERLCIGDAAGLVPEAPRLHGEH